MGIAMPYGCFMLGARKSRLRKTHVDEYARNKFQEDKIHVGDSLYINAQFENKSLGSSIMIKCHVDQVAYHELKINESGQEAVLASVSVVACGQEQHAIITVFFPDDDGMFLIYKKKYN